MSYQSEPITMWIDRRLVLRKSLIQGIGTFAIELIPAGQLLILTTGGLVLTPEDRQSGTVDLEAEMYNEEWLPSGLSIVTPKVFHYYVNHCCEPNAIDLSRSPNITQYIAWRDIPAQEEITTDYGIFGAARIDRCMCKSPNCRGRVTPDDWQLPEMQQRYRGYFPWHLEQRIQQVNKYEDRNISQRGKQAAA
jgi:SET domain-containing protein